MMGVSPEKAAEALQAAAASASRAARHWSWDEIVRGSAEMYDDLLRKKGRT